MGSYSSTTFEVCPGLDTAISPMEASRVFVLGGYFCSPKANILSTQSDPLIDRPVINLRCAFTGKKRRIQRLVLCAVLMTNVRGLFLKIMDPHQSPLIFTRTPASGRHSPSLNRLILTDSKDICSRISPGPIFLSFGPWFPKKARSFCFGFPLTNNRFPKPAQFPAQRGAAHPKGRPQKKSAPPLDRLRPGLSGHGAPDPRPRRSEKAKSGKRRPCGLSQGPHDGPIFFGIPQGSGCGCQNCFGIPF